MRALFIHGVEWPCVHQTCGMERILTATSAFQLYRVPPQIIALLPRFPDLGTYEGRKFISDHPDVIGGLDIPLHMLVTPHHPRTTTRLMTPHVRSGALPIASIQEHDLGISVTSPSFTLLMLASRLSEVQLAMATYELCGSFSVYQPPESLELALAHAVAKGDLSPTMGWRRVHDVKGCPTSLWCRPPLITQDDLDSFIANNPGLHGMKRLRAAASEVRGIAASPFEVQTALLLGRSRRKGGAGFTDLRVNKEIRLTKTARSLARRGRCVADIYIEGLPGFASVDIECQGRMIHDTRESAASDDNRALGLESMGIDVKRITYESIAQPDAFEALCALVARTAGRKHLPKTPAMRRAEANLRHDLFIDWRTLGS